MGDEFDHGTLYLREVGELFVHVVDGYMQGVALGFELLEWFAVQAVGFAHKTAEAVTIDSVLMQGFGCPNQNLRLSLRRQNMRTQRPNDITLALRTSRSDAKIAAEAH